MLKYRMLQIRSSERIIHLPQGSYLLGRALPCHLLIQERTVSGEHCRIWHQDDVWQIKDLNSTNGTLLDGIALIKNQDHTLPQQAQIKMGTQILEIEWDDVEPDSALPSFPIVLLSQKEETSTINQKTLYADFSSRSVDSQPDSKPIEIISRNPVMQHIYDEARDLASTLLPVAIEGETGSGKELLARFIHRQSARRGALITLVPTTNETLQESEFFGYRKGAFTGADRDYPGKIKLADNGTLFLDEISHIPQSLQVRLLRFLENGEIFPLGAHRAETVDVRLLVASNVPFKKLVREGTLREDFYYRLCIQTLTLVPLRERPEDILPLFGHFFSSGASTIPKEFAACLLRYPWPGNIRELKAEAQRLRLRVKEPDQLCPDILSPALRGERTGDPASSPLVDPGRKLREKRIIEETLNECRGNKSLAAEQLQISRRGLYKKMKRLGMSE